MRNWLKLINELLGYFVQFCTYHRRWIQRMKEDPAYRKEIMDWLRADARASHGVPFGVHVTTTITGAGATCYGANVYHDDSAATKAAKRIWLIRRQKVHLSFRSHLC